MYKYLLTQALCKSYDRRISPASIAIGSTTFSIIDLFQNGDIKVKNC